MALSEYKGETVTADTPTWHASHRIRFSIWEILAADCWRSQILTQFRQIIAQPLLLSDWLKKKGHYLYWILRWMYEPTAPWCEWSIYRQWKSLWPADSHDLNHLSLSSFIIFSQCGLPSAHSADVHAGSTSSASNVWLGSDSYKENRLIFIW